MPTQPAATSASSRTRRPGRPGAISGLALAGALVLGGLGVGTAGAEDGGDPVARALATPGSLHTLDDVRELGELTEGDEGVPIGVVSDRNGDAPGGIDVTRVVADRSQVAPLSDELSGVDQVVSAGPDHRVRATADPLVSQQYGPVSIRASLLPPTADGLGTTVAVIDSGVAGSHFDLAPLLRDGTPRVLSGTSFLRPAQAGGADLTGQPGNSDPYGHGTHVAGIISAARDNGLGGAGVAPGARILPVRVLDTSGEGWSSDVAAAIRWAHQSGADIINLSLSGPEDSADVDAAIDTVTADTSRGKPATVVFAAAGNGGVTSPAQWPAAHETTIAVAATTSSHEAASFSSRGSYVDIAAPGVDIESTCITGGYCWESGTSMATPLAAGAAAILRQQSPGTSSPAQIRSRLREASRDVGDPGWDAATGDGEIDLAATYDPGTWPPFPRIPSPPPPPPPPPPPVQMPSGYIADAFADGRLIVVAGRVYDPDGQPMLIVNSTLFGDRLPQLSSTGQWLGVFVAEPGTHRICVTALDNPTGLGISLGCRDVVVK